MRRFGSSNVAFKKVLNADYAFEGERASYLGVGKKLVYFLLMTVLGAFGGIFLAFSNPTVFGVLLAISGIATFILSLMSMMSNRMCKVTGPLYCLMEGAFIGVLSFAVSTVLDGVVTMALLSTIAVFGVVAVLYLTRLVKVGSGFTRFLLIFSIGFIISQLLFMLVSAFTGIGYSIGLVSIVSLVSVFLATLYLFFDMENIRQIVEGGYPKETEWTASFGLAFTLIWLYVEILRLILIFASDRD